MDVRHALRVCIGVREWVGGLGWLVVCVLERETESEGGGERVCV